MDKLLGLLFPICDADKRHMSRFRAELTRLALPFAVHFDHCCNETKQLFKSHPLFVGCHEDDDPKSFFDESSRNSALAILKATGFETFIHMDVDETLELEAPDKLAEAVDEMRAGRCDLVGMHVLNLWGDRNHHRCDPNGPGNREKMFNLKIDPTMVYYHPTIHAPKVKPHGREAVVWMSPCLVLHWGIMSFEDAEDHQKRWAEIYTRKVGGDPYLTYQYLMDRSINPLLKPVPAGVLVEGVDR